jgi:hypothetical protein
VVTAEPSTPELRGRDDATTRTYAGLYSSQPYETASPYQMPALGGPLSSPPTAFAFRRERPLRQLIAQIGA